MFWGFGLDGVEREREWLVSKMNGHKYERLAVGWRGVICS